MAVKLGTQIIITDNNELNNISGYDDTTKTMINDAVVGVDNGIVIKNAAGTVIKEVYGGLKNYDPTA